MSDDMPLKRAACYLSTPSHVRSFVGRFVYIYTDKGELTLTETALWFVGKDGLPIVIPLDSVTALGVGHYSRIAKPLRLDYLAVPVVDDPGVADEPDRRRVGRRPAGRRARQRLTRFSRRTCP